MPLRRIPNKAIPQKGEIFTIRPAVGPTYNIIALKLTNVTKAELENIQVKLRGKPVQQFRNGTRVQALNDHYKRYSKGTAWLFFYFQRTEFDKLEDQKIFSLGTRNLDTFTIEMKVNSVSAVPKIDVYADTDIERDVGVITKIREYPQDFSQAGTHDIADLPTGQAPILAVHYASSNMTDLKLSADSYDLVEEMGVDAVAAFNESKGVLSNITGYVHVSQIAEGTPMTAYPTEGVHDLRSRIELSAAESFDAIVEVADTFSGL